jgi:hypothetical protein
MTAKSSWEDTIKETDSPRYRWNFAEKDLKIEPLDLSVVGFRVVAIDGKAGRIANPVDEISSAHLLLSRGWFLRKARLVTVNAVKSVDSKQRKVFLTWTKAQLKKASEEHLRGCRSTAGCWPLP